MSSKHKWLIGLTVLAVVLSFLGGCAPAAQQSSVSPADTSTIISNSLKTKYTGESLGSGVLFLIVVLVVSVGVAWFLADLRKGRHDDSKVFSRRTVITISSLLFGLLLLIWLLVGSYVTVDAGYVGVVVRQGKPMRYVSPGAHLVTPYLESLVLFPTHTWTYATMTDPSQGNEDYCDSSVDMVTLDGVGVKVNYTFQGALNPVYAVKILEKYGTLVNAISQVVKFPSRVKVRYTLGGFDADSFLTKLDAMEGTVVQFMEPIMSEAGLELVLFGFRKPELGIAGAYEKELDATQVAYKQKLTEEAKVEVENQRALQLEEQAKGRKLEAIQDAQGKAESTRLAADAAAYEVETAAKAKAFQIETEAKAQARAIEEINQMLAKNPGYLEYLRVLAWQTGGARVPQVVGADAPGIWLQLNPGQP